MDLIKKTAVGFMAKIEATEQNAAQVANNHKKYLNCCAY